MRSLFKLAFSILLTVSAAPAFAQGTAAIAIDQPWARATPAGAQTGAAYMTIDNKTNVADRLTGCASTVADKVQIHEMKMVSGVMQMREVADGLAVPANGSVTLKPGSYHIMLIGLKHPLKAGDSVPMTLTFAKAGNISVTVPVQAMGASGAGEGGMSGMGGDDKAGGGMGKMEMK